MVFLIQHTQNRDSEAAQLKLNELIRAVKGAKNSLLDVEDLEDEDLDHMRESYEKLAATARTELGRRKRPGSATKPPRRKPSRTNTVGAAHKCKCSNGCDGALLNLVAGTIGPA